MYIYPLLSTEKLQNSFYNNLNIFFDIVYINLFWVNLLDTAGRQLDILEMTWFISNVNGSFILIRSYMNKTPNDTIPNNKCSENLLNKFIKTNDAEDILYHYAVKYYTRFNTISYIHNIISFTPNYSWGEGIAITPPVCRLSVRLSVCPASVTFFENATTSPFFEVCVPNFHSR